MSGKRAAGGGWDSGPEAAAPSVFLREMRSHRRPHAGQKQAERQARLCLGVTCEEARALHWQLLSIMFI